MLRELLREGGEGSEQGFVREEEGRRKGLIVE